MFISHPVAICEKAGSLLLNVSCVGCFSLWGVLGDACWTIGCWAPTVSSTTVTWVTYCSPVTWSSVISPLSFTFLLRDHRGEWR